MKCKMQRYWTVLRTFTTQQPASQVGIRQPRKSAHTTRNCWICGPRAVMGIFSAKRCSTRKHCGLWRYRQRQDHFHEVAGAAHSARRTVDTHRGRARNVHCAAQRGAPALFQRRAKHRQRHCQKLRKRLLMMAIDIIVHIKAHAGNRYITGINFNPARIFSSSAA